LRIYPAGDHQRKKVRWIAARMVRETQKRKRRRAAATSRRCGRTHGYT